MRLTTNKRVSDAMDINVYTLRNYDLNKDMGERLMAYRTSSSITKSVCAIIIIY